MNERTDVRDEISALRQENEQLRKQNHEYCQRIAHLEEQVKDLLGRLAKTSRNSSKPPSSDGMARKTRSLRRRSGKPPGGQEGHPGQHLAQVATPDEVVRLHPQTCAACQHSLKGVPGMVHERRQVFELPEPRLWVTEYQTEQVRCPACHGQTPARFPEAVRAAAQYGPRVRAVAVYWHQYHLVPYQRVAQAMREVFGCPVTSASIVAWVQHCAKQVGPFEAEVKSLVQASPVQHNDETGAFVHGVLHWLHTASTSQVTYYWLHRHRGKRAMDAAGTLVEYPGVSVHDGWKSYAGYPCQHALCHAHLLRELLFLAEQQHQEWAVRLTALFLVMKQLTEQARQRGEDALRPALRLVVWRQYRQILAEGFASNPVRQRDGPPQRGKVKQSDATNLLLRLQEQEEAVLLFLDDLRVPFDNNLAERDIRMTKVQQKVSGGFRSLEGGQAFCRIRGFVSTFRKQGRAVLEGLLRTFQGECLPAVLPS